MSERIGVLQIIDTLGVGGAERLLPILARAIDRRHFDLHVLSLRPMVDTPVSRDLRTAGVPVHSLGFVRLRDLHTLPAFRRLLNVQSIDLVHTHLGLSNTWGVLAARTARRPVVATVHNIRDEDQRFGRVKSRLQGVALRWGATRVIACGPNVRTYVGAAMHVLPHRIVDIPNGIDLMPFGAVPPEETRAARQALLRGRPGPLIVAVGTLTAAKGHDSLVQAMPKILNACPGAALALVGPHADRSALIGDIVNRLGIGEAVYLAGAREDIPAVLTAADLFVLPSRREALPLSLLEAMAAGTPVVASAVGGVPHVLRGETGILVPSEDVTALTEAVISVLRCPDRGAAMAARARQRAHEHFGAHVWARRLEVLYEQVVAC